MKKSVTIGLLLLSLTVAANAQIRIGLGGGYALPSDSLYKGGLALGFQLGLAFGRNFAVEIGVSRFQGDVEGSEAGLSQGSLSRLPIELSLQGRFPIGAGRIVPFVFAGGGYSLHSFKLDSSVTAPWSNVGVTIGEKAENGPVFHAGLGLEVLFMPKMAFQVNLKYLISSADASWTQTDNGTGLALAGNLEALKLSALLIHAGFKYSF